MRYARESRAIPLLALLLAAACSASDSHSERRLAYLGAPAERALVAPDTVRQNVPFTVTVFAVGSGTEPCNTPDGVNVESGASVVRVQPYFRYTRVDGLSCTSDAKRYAFTTQMTVRDVGSIVLRAVGSATPYGVSAVPDSIERRVVVIP